MNWNDLLQLLKAQQQLWKQVEEAVCSVRDLLDQTIQLVSVETNVQPAAPSSVVDDAAPIWLQDWLQGPQIGRDRKALWVVGSTGAARWKDVARQIANEQS